jgi:DNA-nicking Smr family endonuclease
MKISDIHKYRNYRSVIDLHGYTIHQGWEKFNETINNCYLNGQNKIVVITGQGLMMREFPVWCDNHYYVKSCNQSKNNPGSFTLKLKKKKI